MKKRSVAFLLAFIMLLSACGSSSQASFQQAVDALDAETAASVYDGKIHGNQEKEKAALEYVLSAFQNWIEAYGGGEKTQEDVDAFLAFADALAAKSSFSLSSKFKSLQNIYDSLKTSKEKFAEAQKLLEKHALAEAIKALSFVIEEDKENYDTAQAKIGETKSALTKEATAKLTEYAGTGDYVAAHAYYDSLDAKLFDDGLEELDKLLQQAKEKYVAASLASAEAAFGAEKNAAAALDVLRHARGESGLTDFDQKMEEYQTYLPVPLSDLEYTTKGGGLNARQQDQNIDPLISKDVNETVYDDGMIIYPNNTEEEAACTITYYLNQKYSAFMGTLYRPYSTLKVDSRWVDEYYSKSTVFRVYGDGVLLYEAPNFTKSTFDPVDFSVDVTGVRELKIVMLSPNHVFGSSAANPRIAATNLYLRK